MQSTYVISGPNVDTQLYHSIHDVGFVVLGGEHQWRHTCVLAIEIETINVFSDL